MKLICIPNLNIESHPLNLKERHWMNWTLHSKTMLSMVYLLRSKRDSHLAIDPRMSCAFNYVVQGSGFARRDWWRGQSRISNRFNLEINLLVRSDYRFWESYRIFTTHYYCIGQWTLWFFNSSFVLLLNNISSCYVILSARYCCKLLNFIIHQYCQIRYSMKYVTVCFESKKACTFQINWNLN